MSAPAKPDAARSIQVEVGARPLPAPSQPPVIAAAEPASPREVPSISPSALSRATVRTGSAAREMHADDQGVFPRVYAEAGETLPVTLAFPQGREGDVVVVEVQDGGHLGEQAVARAFRLGPDLATRFACTLNADPGTYRVLVRRGAQTLLLDFWVGPETPLNLAHSS